MGFPSIGGCLAGPCHGAIGDICVDIGVGFQKVTGNSLRHNIDCYILGCIVGVKFRVRNQGIRLHKQDFNQLL